MLKRGYIGLVAPRVKHKVLGVDTEILGSGGIWSTPLFGARGYWVSQLRRPRLASYSHLLFPRAMAYSGNLPLHSADLFCVGLLGSANLFGGPNAEGRKRESVSSPVGLKITRDGSSYGRDPFCGRRAALS